MRNKDKESWMHAYSLEGSTEGGSSSVYYFSTYVPASDHMVPKTQGDG